MTHDICIIMNHVAVVQKKDAKVPFVTIREYNNYVSYLSGRTRITNYSSRSKGSVSNSMTDLNSRLTAWDRKDYKKVLILNIN